jgi:hypothetical protein
MAYGYGPGADIGGEARPLLIEQTSRAPWAKKCGSWSPVDRAGYHQPWIAWYTVSLSQAPPFFEDYHPRPPLEFGAYSLSAPPCQPYAAPTAFLGCLGHRTCASGYAHGQRIVIQWAIRQILAGEVDSAYRRWRGRNSAETVWLQPTNTNMESVKSRAEQSDTDFDIVTLDDSTYSIAFQPNTGSKPC